MKLSKILLILSLAVFGTAACETTETLETNVNTPNAANVETTKTDEAIVEKPEWAYTGETGAENWTKLEMADNACDGKVQSPIDIVTKDVKPGEGLSQIEFKYGESDANIVNNGHTIQFNTTGDNKIMISDKEYELLQFHYHAESEHKIDGKQFPLEVHFVHKGSDTDYAVLGVMFEEGAENEFLKTYLNVFPTEKGEKKGENKIDLESLFPENTAYYNYKGSLTTPPCSEVVT